MRALNPSGTGCTASAIVVSLLPCRSLQNAPRLNQMRPVDHPAADAQHPGARMRFERRDDRLGVADILLGRGERGIDDGHLRRVDRKLAGEALATSRFGFGLEAFFVL